MTGLSTVLYHDCFAIRGGGERLALTLARGLNATLVYGYRLDDSFEPDCFPASTRSLELPSSFRRRGLRPVALSAVFAAEAMHAAKFDIRIFSGVAAPFASPRKDKTGLNVFYCHTPPRFLFDQRDHFLGKDGIFKRIAANLYEKAYRKAILRMDVIATNSENTRLRIKKYLGVDSHVVHPPVDTDRFQWKGQSDYYLSVARLTALKRVDLIIDAFRLMPDKRLVVVSGGEERSTLISRAANAPNITFLNWLSDDDLIETVGKAIATIYVPKDEDFGMSPVESMAAGKPVIGVAEGGILETVVHGVTGVLLSPDFGPTEIIQAVRGLTAERAAAMRCDCEDRARAFTREAFLAGMRLLIQEAQSSYSTW